MNAHFTLTQQSADSELLSRLDMSDAENVKDARCGLIAAGDDVAKLAVWAGRWGAALCTEHERQNLSAEIEGDLKELTKVVGVAVHKLDQLEGQLPETHRDAIGEISTLLGDAI